MATPKAIRKARHYMKLRAGAYRTSIYRNGNFIPCWIATLGRKAVTMDNNTLNSTRIEAIEEARAFKRMCAALRGEGKS